MPQPKGCTPWNKGKTGIYSQETRQRIADGVRRHLQDPVAKATMIEKNSITMTARWQDPEFRERNIGARSYGVCPAGCECGRHSKEYEAPSYEAVHGRAARRLRGTSCAFAGEGCSSGRLQTAWLWTKTPWEFVRTVVRTGTVTRPDATAIRWWSVREEDYAMMCGRHHKMYDQGELFFRAYNMNLGEAA